MQMLRWLHVWQVATLLLLMLMLMLMLLLTMMTYS
jgi:hypothetical protein